jgi:plastocyanin
MGRPLLFVAVPLVMVGALVAGCGSDDKKDTTATQAPAPKSDTSAAATPASGGGGSKLALAADPSGALKFDKTKLDAKAGKVTIVMDNPSSVPHAIEVEGNGVEEEGKTVTQGGKSTVSADLKPGTYEFYCPVDSHKEQGMEGTLTVS